MEEIFLISSFLKAIFSTILLIFLIGIGFFFPFYLFLKNKLKKQVQLQGNLKNLKILYVIPGKESDKSFPFARRQIKLLSSNYGIQIKILYLESRNSCSKMAKLALQFIRIEQNFKPHIVHCHYGSVTSLFTVLCAKAPVIITFHGSDLNCTPWIGRYRDRFGRTCSQCAILGAARTICVSEHLQNLLFWKKKFSNVIPIGTDTNEFVPMNREACRRLLKWNLSDKVVLFNANKALIKRLDIAENAIKVARKKVNELRMEVMDGNVDPIMLPVYMNASNCVLLCSDNEGSPTIIKEAMACNIPVISIDVGDVKQNLVDISPGGIYEKNHFSLAEGIIKVIDKNSPSNGREKLIERGLTSQALDFKVVQVYMEMVKFQHPDLVPEPAYSVPVEDDITIEILAKDLQV